MSADGFVDMPGPKEGLSGLEKSVLTNFYWSFHHSQGDPNLQTHIAAYVARQYDPATLPSIDGLGAHIQPHIEGLAVPKAHSNEYTPQDSMNKAPLTRVAAQESEQGFKKRWEKNIDILKRTLHPNLDAQGAAQDPVEPDVRMTVDMPDARLVVNIFQQVAKRDEVFQENVRPNRKDGQDPHESFLKTYVIDGKDAHTPELTKMYGDVRVFLEKLGVLPAGWEAHTPEQLQARSRELGLSDRFTAELVANFDMMKSAWEANHPGRAFLAQAE